MMGENDGFIVEVAFQFENRNTGKKSLPLQIIFRIEGGTHITGFKTAFTNSMNKLSKQYGLIEENLNGDMMRRGITLAVSVKMNKAPVFQGQTKEKLMTAEARAAG